MTDRSDQIDSILCAAVDLPTPEERADYIRRQSAGDDQMRLKVEGLLSAYLRAGDFLQSPTPALPPTINLGIAEGAGAVIGPYKLLEQIGEGGMGVVFMAEQTQPVQRRVALKIIKPGMDTRQVIARFEAERQALALMDHPNIARVIDAGATENGRPYFVMDLVKGVPITDYCDRRRLSVRERLELMTPVCHAVQHAHQKGIIHRDLKPSNVLVAEYDGHPVPKIIDFGVAKATAQSLTDRTMFTQFGQIIGTFEYMSPEQAQFNQLDVDTRSDVYSLGVLLYELLAGSTPFEQSRLHEAAIEEVLRIIREEDPPKPSTKLSSSKALPSVAANRHTEPARLSKDIRGELDWIVMKCLEKDRIRRYDSAGSFARDIERYLYDEPVQACPPSATYRLKKFIRRNRIAAAFVLLLMLAVATLALSNVQTRRNERRANTESAKGIAVSNLLQQMLASSNPDEVKGADYTVRQLLDDFSAGVVTQLSGQPEIDAEIRATIGKAYWRLGMTDQAELHLKRALELRRSLFGPNDEKVADSLVDYAWNLAEQSRHAEAETAIRDGLRIYSASGTAAPKVILARSGLQRFLISLGRYGEARAVAEEALSLARSAGGDYPVMANILHDMAEAEIKQGRYAEAEQNALQAVAMHRRLHDAEHPETAWGLRTLGVALLHQRKYADAEVALREALAIFRKSYRNDHKTISFVTEDLLQLFEARGDEVGVKNLMHQQLDETTTRMNHEMLVAWIAQGHAYTRLGEWDAATNAYREASRLDPNDFSLQNELGVALSKQWKIEEAVAAYRKAIELNPDNPAPYVNLARALRKIGQFDEAVASYRKAINLQPQSPSGYTGLAWLFANASNANFRDPTRAIELAEKAVQLEPENRNYTHLLGIARYRAGEWQAAIDNLRDGEGGEDWIFLAMAHHQLGEHREAREWYDRAVEWIDKNLPNDQEQRRLLAEAAELLALPEQTPSVHADP